ncbi:hypothetical protein BC835DRAFT_1289183 [Cytidiella melzeri]|nr:hypothetical protein BC835DRAFT_1300930 [Cytidiella melzeri]KAI0685870.1 hypothetical protein BC835DRAFT_1289183 [Cytidiella melzeri]
MFLGADHDNEDPEGRSVADHSDFHFSPNLRPELVWDAVILLCLVEDSASRGMSLDLSHTDEQETRLRKAMLARNIRMQRFGLGQILHRCDKCTRFFDNRATGQGLCTSCTRTRVVVIDGVTIGHPCCTVHNCQTTLEKQHHRFCRDHAGLNLQCAIKDCTSPILAGHLVCADETHREIEKRHRIKGQARFRPKSTGTGAEGAADVNRLDGEEVFDVDNSSRVVSVGFGPAEHLHAPAQGSKRLRAQFGRRRTHNEQLIVAPCGVIIARATFFGSEAVSSDFIKAVYQFVPPPEHIFFDNNCHLSRMVKGKDPYFDNVGLSVDVFHFDCKHSVTDAYCQQHCNPRSFGELQHRDGRWYFNSSACEQVNSWITEYQSMCREMSREKFEFFLDEMIMRRNKWILGKLERNGQHPTYWELDELRQN